MEKDMYVVKDGGRFFFWNKTHYDFNNYSLKRLLKERIPSLTSSQMNEIATQIKIDAMSGALEDTIQVKKYNGVISLKNGMYNIFTDKIIPHDPRYFIKNYVDVQFNEDAYDVKVEEHISKIFKGSPKLIKKF
jgi:phage/plasmid-associated DNA primase